jgi:hypothetical protein
MKKGYRVWSGELEVVAIINEHNLCYGATQETYLCKGPNGKFACSKDMYFNTELKAWEEYFNRLNEGIKYKREKIAELDKEIQEHTLILGSILSKMHVLEAAC